MPRHSKEPGRAWRRVEDARGKARDRRRRKRWLLEQFGDGTVAPCTWCGALLDFDTMEVDRFPVCGHDGGRYTRDNIVPACSGCNGTRCARCRAERDAESREAELEQLARDAWRSPSKRLEAAS